VGVFRDYYATMAQVFPVLLLAFAAEGRYLDRLKREPRTRRRPDGSGDVRFWLKPRVRRFTFFVVGVIVVDIVLAVLVLADVVPESSFTRYFLLVGLALIVGTLAVRMCADVADATTEPAPPPTGPPPVPPSGPDPD
jgi:hypothetical protein